MENTSFQQRRMKLLSLMQDGVAIIPAAGEVTRSHDTEYPFRQDSSFKYLTGFSEPDAVLVLCQNNKHVRDVLFVRPKNPEMEMWTGKRLGVEQTKNVFDFDEVYCIDDFDAKIGDLLKGHKNLYIDFFHHKAMADRVHPILQSFFNRRRLTEPTPTSMINLYSLVGKLRLYKSANEIQAIKTAIGITKDAHKAAMAFAAPGKNEREVHALIKYIFNKKGADAEAYHSIVAGGDNANILHYINNNCELKNKDLLLIDAGSEFGLYASDITRTFPVNGKFTDVQKDLYQLVLQSQKDAFNVCLPGKTLDDVHTVARRTLTQGLIDFKLLTGSVDENMEKHSYRSYYPHGTGHWLGMDVHDQCPYNDEDFAQIKLKAGMVFTVEPGLYFAKGKEDVPEKFEGIGIRIEDNILITETGYENMSAAIPKELKEVEEQCAQDWQSYLV